MVITFSSILFALLILVKPLQKNAFYILHSVLIVAVAHFFETYIFTASPFAHKTILLFVVFHLVSINITTIFAYWVDKRAAIRKTWRVSENNLHTLEFLGGWSGAYLAQKMFRHKTKKKSYQTTFKLMIALEVLAIYVILKYLKLL